MGDFLWAAVDLAFEEAFLAALACAYPALVYAKVFPLTFGILKFNVRSF